MTEFHHVFKRTKLFDGLVEQDLGNALGCLSIGIKAYVKNEIIFREGEVPDFVGIILSGEVQTRKTDYDGNANIVSKLYSTDCIAASVCYATDKRLPFDVVCVDDSQILRLDKSRLIQPCQNSCSFHVQLIQNFLTIIADRNLILAGKIDILTKRTLREKILAYLHAQSRRSKSSKFSVPLSRLQMAEFLSVNRSALSRELSALRDEGVLDFEKNLFLLKNYGESMP